MKLRTDLLLIAVIVVSFLALVLITIYKRNYFTVTANYVHEITSRDSHLYSIQQFREDSEANNIPLLIDVRDRDKFEEYHLKDAVNIPFRDILGNKGHRLFKQSQKLKVVYSDDIAESSQAWAILMQLDYKNLYVFDINEALLKADTRNNDSLQYHNERLRYTFHPDNATNRSE